MTTDRFNKVQESVVLLVEDSPTQALVIQNFLLEAGLQVIVATNGKMGVRLARKVLPNLILLDIQMPDMNGFEVCEQLKQGDETAAIPIVMLTRQDTQEAVKQSLQSGAVDFIPKDAFTTVVLLEALRQMGLLSDGSNHPDTFLKGSNIQ